MSELPHAPDADPQQSRTIEFSYDLNAGGHAFFHVERDDCMVTRRRIGFLKDGEEVRCPDAIDLLKSWGIVRESRIVDLPNPKTICMIDRVYMIHDTPMVRDLIRKIDGEHCRQLSARLQELIEEAHQSGYTIKYFSPLRTIEWTEAPADMRAMVVKGDWELLHEFTHWRKVHETLGLITVYIDEGDQHFDTRTHRLVKSPQGHGGPLKIFKRVVRG